MKTQFEKDRIAIIPENELESLALRGLNMGIENPIYERLETTNPERFVLQKIEGISENFIKHLTHFSIKMDDIRYLISKLQKIIDNVENS